MRRYLTVLFAALAVLLASFGVYSLVLKGSPKIEVTPAYKHLGNVTKEGFNYTFTVRNTGKAPLRIYRVSTSCGCTSAAIDSELIPPGAETGLHVAFNPKIMEEVVKGKVLRIVFIRSNDPENPEVEIKITANVVDG